MNSSKHLQENISAMLDGELPDSEVELTLAALALPEGQEAWHTYQLIGDLLRADQQGMELSKDFHARLAARLAQEEAPAASPEDAPLKRAAPAAT
jgi:sigma-E factor negative regulatory protein RseA